MEGHGRGQWRLEGDPKGKGGSSRRGRLEGLWRGNAVTGSEGLVQRQIVEHVQVAGPMH